METKVKNKTKGISLIVLVITILVLAILAATVIISLSNTNVISEASKSVLKSDLTTMQDMATVYMADNYNLVDVEREYLITEFGITDEKYKGYETIATVKAGKVYIKPNAPENVKEVAQELNILIDGVSADNGNVTLDKTATALKIYGNTIENATTNAIQSVGDKTKNLVNIPDVEIKQTNNYYAQTTITTSQVLNVIEEALENGAISISFDIDGENIDKFSKEIVIFYTNTSGERKYIDTGNLNNITKPDDWESMISFYLRARSNSADYKGTVIKVSNIQVEKGATATDYEPYGYKIPVTMTGKNLFNINSEFEVNYGTTTIENNKIYLEVNSQNIITSIFHYIKVEPREKITISFKLVQGDARIGFRMYDEDKNLIDNSAISIAGLTYNSYYQGYYVSSNTISFTIPDGVEYIRPFFCGMNNSDEVTNIYEEYQIEKGNLSTTYESYNGKVYNIYLSEPLRKVGDVADYVDCTTGEVVRCVGVNSESGKLEILNMPVRESINIETIDFVDVKHIFVDSLIVPSNIEAQY